MNENTQNLYQSGWQYDLVMGAYVADRPLGFYQQQIARYGEPVLELACGSGRYTIPLATGGAAITGLDLSAEMLRLGTLKAAERGVAVTFMQADMRDFELGKTFKLIIIPAQSLSHLHERSEIEACFACVRRHLAPEGRLIIELFNPSIALLARDPEHRYPIGEYPHPGGSGRMLVTCQTSYDAATQVNQIRYFYQHEDAETILTFEMRQFFPQEIDALISYNGFQIEQKYGDVDQQLFTSAAPKQLLVCALR